MQFCFELADNVDNIQKNIHILHATIVAHLIHWNQLLNMKKSTFVNYQTSK